MNFGNETLTRVVSRRDMLVAPRERTTYARVDRW
jgi:hypothetical protein